MRVLGLGLVALGACAGTASPVLTTTGGSVPGASGTLHPGAIGIAAGGAMACALNADGTMACWGDDPYNQTAALDGMFTQITAAASYVCGLRTDGTVACSRNDELPPPGRFAQISAGPANSTCGIRFDGTSACWFHDWWEKTMPASERFVTISNGGAFGCGLHADGTAVCWGGDSQPPPPPTGAFAAIDALSRCAIQPTGDLSCWSLEGSFPLPPAAKFQAVNDECGIQQDGSLACWGYLARFHPGLVRPMSGTFTALSVAQYDAPDGSGTPLVNLCALTDNGAVRCIGSQVPEAVP